MKRSNSHTAALTGVMLMSAGVATHGQNSEIEQLRSAVRSMQGTIYSLSTNLANANARLAEMEKREKQQTGIAGPPPPVVQPGVPPPTAPGAMPDLKAEASKSDLADSTTYVPYQDTIKEDDIGAARPGNAPLDPTYQGFMQLFGTRTWMKIGGYAKLDMIADSTKVGNPNSFVTGTIPVEGEANFDKDARFTIHAKQTRINVELRSPTPIGSLKIFYENDFFNNSSEPNMDYRLRHFYGQVANVLAGQTWTTFYDPDSFPDTLDFEGPGSLPVLRQPQLRYTLPISESMNMAFGIEQPKSSDLSNLPDGADGRNTLPDFTSHWRWEGKAGHMQVSGLLRRLSYDGANGDSGESELGWGLQLSGSLKTWGEDKLVANVIYGDGIGRYVQDLPGGSGAVVDTDGNLDTQTAWGAMAGYRHQWCENWRSTVSYSYVHLDSEDALGGLAYDHTHYAQVNLIWAPTKNFYVGLEYLYGMKEAHNGNDGDNHRIQAALQYKLIR